MVHDPDGKLTFKIKPSGTLVQLTGSPFAPVRPLRLTYFDDCWPPQPVCPVAVATYVWSSIRELQKNNPDAIATLAFRIESSQDQPLCLLVQISEGEGAEYLWNQKFVTNGYKLQASGGSTYVFGLDQAASRAAAEYFVPGNTLALVVLPLQKEKLFKVDVGTAAQGEAAAK